MPTIVTRGAVSARAAGIFSAAPPPPPPVPPPPVPPPPPPPGPPPVYQTVTFTSSGYWTAPAGVSTVISLTVAGGLYNPGGTTSYYDNTGNIYAVAYTASYDQAGSPSAFYTYEFAGTQADSVLSQFNSGGTGDRTVTYSPTNLYWNPSTGGYYSSGDFASIRIRGVASRLSGPWDNRSGNPVGGPSTPPIQWGIGVEVIVDDPGGPGTASSALGYTAAGATNPNQAQVVVTQYYVTVVPGRQYYIEVGGASGYVTLQFQQS